MSDEQDAKRYRWLRDQLDWKLGYYQTYRDDDSSVCESGWIVKSEAIFTTPNEDTPESLDAAIDVAMEKTSMPQIVQQNAD